MSQQFHNKLTPADRQEGFLAWLLESGLTLEKLGEKMNVGKSSVSRMYRRNVLAQHRWDQLRAQGVPAHLLPEPGFLKPGPKPKQ